MAIQVPFVVPPTGNTDNQSLGRNLRLINTQFNYFNDGTANWDNVYIGTASTTTGILRFYNSASAFYTAFQAGNALANVTYTLPTNAPAGNNYLLASSTAGVLSWLNAPGTYAPIASPTFTGVVTIPTPFTLGAVSVTTTGTELNYVAGVTSAIQTQLGLKAPLANPTFTGTVTIPTPFTLGAVSVTATGTELNYSAGVTSAIQTQLGAKQTTTLADGKILVGNGSNVATAVTPSSQLTMSNTGAFTLDNASVIAKVLTGYTSGAGTVAATDTILQAFQKLNGNDALAAVKALSNLASVAINTTLVSDTNNTDDLGTSSIAWKDLFLTGSIKNGSATAITPDTTGRVTFPNQPAFLATGAGGSDTDVTGDATVANVAYGTEVFDIGANFASSTFTAPVTGHYLLTCSVIIQGVLVTHTNRILNLVTSNRTYTRTDNLLIAETTQYLELTVVADMDSGDTAAVTLEVDGSTKVVDINKSSGNTRFSGTLLN